VLGTLLPALVLSITLTAQTVTRVTVMTRSGEKVEGVLHSVTGNELVMEVAGQSLKLPLERIRYISFVGQLESVLASKEPATARPIDQALSALKELQAATEVGLLREQYSQKLLDTLPRVNEFVNRAGTDWADVRLAMGMATRLYQAALDLTAWTNAAESWARAAKLVNYAATLASDPKEETHREKPSEATILLGQSVIGRLGVGDTMMSKDLDSSSTGSFNDVFRLELSSEVNIEIDLKNDGLYRAHLTLVDARGIKLEGDMGILDYGSTIRRKLSPGVYFIWAGASGPNQAFSYTLRVAAKR